MRQILNCCTNPLAKLFLQAFLEVDKSTCRSNPQIQNPPDYPHSGLRRNFWGNPLCLYETAYRRDPPVGNPAGGFPAKKFLRKPPFRWMSHQNPIVIRRKLPFAPTALPTVGSYRSVCMNLWQALCVVRCVDHRDNWDVSPNFGQRSGIALPTEMDQRAIMVNLVQYFAGITNGGTERQLHCLALPRVFLWSRHSLSFQFKCWRICTKKKWESTHDLPHNQTELF
jgi:hypothetical protein